MPGSNTNVVQSAVKVLDALRIMCRMDGPVLASQIAADLGISVPTAYRAAETLVATGFARPSPTGHGYVPSFDVLELAGSIVDHLGIKMIAREILVNVARTFGETVTLAVRDGDDVIFIDRIEGSRDLRFFCDIGRRLPLHAGAAPRCLLSHLSDAEFETYLDRVDLQPLTPRTRITRQELEHDRREIRRHGYSVSIDEVDLGVSAVGVPILNPTGDVLAVIAIASLSVRWHREDIRARATAMREAAVRIQNQCWPTRLGSETSQ